MRRSSVARLRARHRSCECRPRQRPEATKKSSRAGTLLPITQITRCNYAVTLHYASNVLIIDRDGGGFAPLVLPRLGPRCHRRKGLLRPDRAVCKLSDPGQFVTGQEGIGDLRRARVWPSATPHKRRRASPKPA